MLGNQEATKRLVASKICSPLWAVLGCYVLMSWLNVGFARGSLVASINILFSCRAVRPWRLLIRSWALFSMGFADVFGGVVSSVRNWRVSGVSVERVGRLLAWATNCWHINHFNLAQEQNICVLGRDPWFLCCLPVWKALSGFLVPTCSPVVTSWTSKQLLWP